MSVPGIKTAAGYELQTVYQQGGGVTADPDPRTCEYTHFDLSTEQLGRTQRYNCWGFTFLPRRYWIGSSHEVDRILQDNCIPVADGSLRPGDVIRYRDDNDVTTHTGRVWKVDAGGHCAEVRSKWGSWAEYCHAPLDVPEIYGTNLAYFRQVAPLRGIGDLWIKDAPQDSGEQCSTHLWTSPYIMMDAPPYGATDNQAVYGADNRVWVMVENRSDTAIDNVRVRYYWANPSVGFAAGSWNLIEPSPGHPNPTDAFTVPANSTVQAPYVVWNPSLSQAHQCLLAVAYVNDDPRDSDNPDPLVYPFDIRWENNIAARNVTVVTLKKGMSKKFTLQVVNPFDNHAVVTSKLRARLTVAPRLRILGFPARVVPLSVNLTLGRRRLQPLVANPRRTSTFDRVWGPSAIRRDVDFELTRPRPLGMAELLHLQEKTLAWREEPRIRLRKGEPRDLTVAITAPNDAVAGSNFQVHLEQEVDGQVTGGYTFAVTVVD